MNLGVARYLEHCRFTWYLNHTYTIFFITPCPFTFTELMYTSHIVFTWNMANFATSLSSSNAGIFLSFSFHAFTDFGLKVEMVFFFFPSDLNSDFPALHEKSQKTYNAAIKQDICEPMLTSNTPAPMWKYNTSKVDIQANRKLASNCYQNKSHIWHAYTKSVLKFQAAAMNKCSEIFDRNLTFKNLD